jgi:hypothetical protein
MSAHSWEDPPLQPVGPHGAQHSWEDSVDEDVHAADSDSESDFDQISAGAEFVNLHLHLYLNRTLSAKDFCVGMFWAAKAGIPEATDLGFRPDAPSGHYQRHLNTVLPFFDSY